MMKLKHDKYCFQKQLITQKKLLHYMKYGSK